MDTKRLELCAEELISHRLLQAGMLIAKPKFDVKGTDLLAFVEMNDGVKFCRIQCKGRSVARSRSSVSIPSSYVTDGFVVVLYLDSGLRQELYCFFSSDIQQWRSDKHNNFRLSLNAATAHDQLDFYRLDDSKVNLIASTIRNAEVFGEFRKLVYGKIHATLDSVECVINGAVKPPRTAT